jgi:hypothetical protein
MFRVLNKNCKVQGFPIYFLALAHFMQNDFNQRDVIKKFIKKYGEEPNEIFLEYFPNKIHIFIALTTHTKLIV